MLNFDIEISKKKNCKLYSNACKVIHGRSKILKILKKQSNKSDINQYHDLIFQLRGH